MKRRPRRRANGDGSLYKRSDGLWCAAIMIGGRRVVRTSRDQAKARQMIEQLRGLAATGQPAPVARNAAGTVGEWFAKLIRPDMAPSTVTVIENVGKKLDLSLGIRPIHRVGPADVESFLDQFPVRSRVRQQAYDYLNRAFKKAKKIVPENPCEEVERPRYQKKPHRSFEVHEIEAIIAEARQHRLGGAIILGFLTGMRQGEIFGLRWQDISWAANRLMIRQTASRNRGGGAVIEDRAKTKESIREVILVPDAIRALLSRALHATQEGPSVRQSDLVFPARRRGAVIGSGSFAKCVWKPILEKLGLDARGLHHSRHSAATLLIRKGVPLSVVSQILGHSNTSTTQEVYAHVLQGDADRAMNALLD
jgi:integrase